MSFKFCVVGGGIIGLSSAYCLLENFPNCSVTIIAEKFSPHTLSDHAFGLIVNGTGSPLIRTPSAADFTRATRTYCQNMNEKDAQKAGISQLKVICLSEEHDAGSKTMIETVRSGAVRHRTLSENELEKLGLLARRNKLKMNGSVVDAFEGFFYTVDVSLYLPWLMNRLKNSVFTNGAKRVCFLQKFLNSLLEVEDCDLIVNCSGLGARRLVNDKNVIPVRAQYVKIERTGAEKGFFSETREGTGFILPRRNEVSLGSIHQLGRWDIEEDPKDTEEILHHCAPLLPRNRDSKIKKIGVALRPGRIGGACVALQRVDGGGFPLKVPIIHNYGHGSLGISQHWGCAVKVSELARQCLSPPRF